MRSNWSQAAAKPSTLNEMLGIMALRLGIQLDLQHRFLS